MEITETRHTHATVLALTGRLDGLTSPRLEKQIEDVHATGVTTLIFDLAQLDYVSSAGLRVFLTAAKKFKTAGGHAVFAALREPVREVFDLSGFLTVFDIHADLTTALA